MVIKNNNYVFEVVDFIPGNYQVWNIGDNMADGYLPLCMLVPGTYSIVPESLKAIKVEDADLLKLLRSGASWGVHDLKSCKKVMKRKTVKHWWDKRAKETANQVFSFYEVFTR